MTDAPKIKAIAPWFGGKRTLAPTIVEELGPHRSYWEPFCGSMAVLLAKPKSSHEHVNDLHRELVNLARVIADDDLGPKLYRRLRRTLLSEDMYRQLVSEPTPEDALDQAYRYFVISWFGRNGVSGTPSYNSTAFAVRWTPGGGHGVILCRKIFVDGFARMQNAQTGEVFSNETVSMMVKRKQDHCIIVSVTITPDFVKGESSC